MLMLMLLFISRLREVMERIGDVMQMCCEVSSNRQMKAAVRNSGKGAVVAGGSAFLGGLLLGPAGIAVGKKNNNFGICFILFSVIIK